MVDYQNFHDNHKRIMEIIKVMCSKILFYVNLVIIITMLPNSCNGNKENGLSDNQISGLVTLENQTKHDGIIVYLSGADVGTVTDIDGNFTLSIPDIVDTNSVFTLYYYHTNYDLGQLEIHLEGNSITSNVGDVDGNNYLPTVELEQIFEVSQTLNNPEISHGEVLEGTVTVKNVYNDTIVIGMKEGGGSLIRDWVIFNVLGHDYSRVWKEINLLERHWETLAPSDESTGTFRVGVCTDECSPGELTIPGEYYFIPMIYPWSGHTYTPNMPTVLRQFLKDNHYFIFYDEFVYDPNTNLGRFDYLTITIQ